jgi:hypothetical protein
MWRNINKMPQDFLERLRKTSRGIKRQKFCKRKNPREQLNIKINCTNFNMNSKLFPSLLRAGLDFEDFETF